MARPSSSRPSSRKKSIVLRDHRRQFLRCPFFSAPCVESTQCRLHATTALCRVKNTSVRRFPGALLLQFLIGLALVCQSIRRKLFCGSQSVSGADFHVRFDSSPFPISLRNRVDGPCERNTNGEVVSGRHAAHRMGPTPCGFANNSAPLLGLQVERELLSSGKRPMRGEDIHGLVYETLSWNPGECPVLVCLVIVASGEVIDVG